MAAEEGYKTYAIPENFVDESRIIKGMFRTRNFVEGCIMALLVGIPALLIPIEEFQTRIMVIVAIAGPFFLLGNAGFNGDPISTTLKNAKSWVKARGLMLYDSKAIPLKKSPLDAMLEREAPGDKILNVVDSVKEARRRKAAGVQYIEGVTFDFAPDDELEGLYADEYYDIEDTDEKIIAPKTAAKSKGNKEKKAVDSMLAMDTDAKADKNEKIDEDDGVISLNLNDDIAGSELVLEELVTPVELFTDDGLDELLDDCEITFDEGRLF